MKVGDLVRIVFHDIMDEIGLVVQYEPSWAYPYIVLHGDGSSRYYQKKFVELWHES